MLRHLTAFVVAGLVLCGTAAARDPAPRVLRVTATRSASEARTFLVTANAETRGVAVCDLEPAWCYNAARGPGRTWTVRLPARAGDTFHVAVIAGRGPTAILRHFDGRYNVPALAAPDAGGREIAVRVKLQALSVVRRRRSVSSRRLALGDRVSMREQLYNERNALVGTLYSECVNVGHALPVRAATLQCTSTYLFRNGQVVAVGLRRIRGGWPTREISVVGGSGAFYDSGGAVEGAWPVKGYDHVDILHLETPGAS